MLYNQKLNYKKNWVFQAKKGKIFLFNLFSLVILDKLQIDG